MAADPKKEPAEGKKPLVMVIAALGVVILALAGAMGYFFLAAGHDSEDTGKKHSSKKNAHPPIFEKIDTFVVNLAGEPGGMLQVEFQVELDSPEAKEVIKNYLPKIRSAMILLLSSKTAQDLGTPEGKARLKNQIRQVVNESISDAGMDDPVTGVLFTSLIVQPQ